MAIFINILNLDELIVRVIELKKTITIGRDADSNYVLIDPLLSRIHCSIEQDQDGIIIFTDRNSKNGSQLDGKKITSLKLKINQKIKIGSHWIKIDESQLTAVEKAIIGKIRPKATACELPSLDSTECKTNKLILHSKK